MRTNAPGSGTGAAAAKLTTRLLGELFGSKAVPGVAVRLWDGASWPDPQTRPTTIVLNHPGALRAMLLRGTELGLGEAYLHDDFDVEGDLEAAFDLADDLAPDRGGLLRKLRVALGLLRLPGAPRRAVSGRGPARLAGRRHSAGRDRDAVRYHYDVPGDFYALWLDRRMVYSCAYFLTPGEALDDAQERKLDYICRKLRLRPGQRLLDVGCGWGGLLLYAAERYDVYATGVTVSRPQAELADARIARAGQAGRCRVLERDYRELDGPAGYDALVSVGMFEHVGVERLQDYFRHCWKLLRPGGVFLNHGIASIAADPRGRGKSFTDAYVFPDGELTSIGTALSTAEVAGFEVRDVESLREHYMLTLRHWIRRLEARHEEALRYVDESTYRTWRLFMSGSAHRFRSGRLSVFQALLVKPDQAGRSGMPLTREDWYSNGQQPVATAAAAPAVARAGA